jgi:ribosomal protein L11 methyltransferase
MMTGRTFPALQLRWPSPPEAGAVDRALAEIDDEMPTAVEDLSNGIRVFFPSETLRNRALARLREFSPSSTCTAVDVSDDDWAARSQASLGTVTVDRVVVAPPWARQFDQPGLIQLVIQPSMGFGTGHHASTRLCLRLMQRLDVQAKRVIDIGTGSGVLAIGAGRLGATRVLAVDSDPDALGAAAENVQLNGMMAAVELRQLDLAADVPALTERFDLVLANLTGFLLIRHVKTLSRLAADRGALILSGFEEDETDRVSAAFEALGWTPHPRLDEDGWVGLSLSRSS